MCKQEGRLATLCTPSDTALWSQPWGAEKHGHAPALSHLCGCDNGSLLISARIPQ